MIFIVVEICTFDIDYAGINEFHQFSYFDLFLAM